MWNVGGSGVLVAFHDDAAGSHVVETSSPEKLKGVLPRWGEGGGDGRSLIIFLTRCTTQHPFPTV